MDQRIAGLTRSIINDLEYNKEPVTRERMLLYTQVYHRHTLQNMEHSKDPSRLMIDLVALKQMIDTLSYTP